MATSQEIHRLIAKIGSDPRLIDELLKEGDARKRKQILVGRGLLKEGDSFTRQEIIKEMGKLIAPGLRDPGLYPNPDDPRPGPGPRPGPWPVPDPRPRPGPRPGPGPDPVGRVVEWVGAVATAAAGAAAVACTAD